MNDGKATRTWAMSEQAPRKGVLANMRPFLDARRPLGLLVALAIVLVSLPAEAQVLTLSELERRAIEGNPQVRVREARVAAAATRIDATQRETQPTLNLDVGGVVGPGGAFFRVKDVDGNVYNASGVRALGDGSDAWIPQARVSATVRYGGNFYDFGRTRARVDAAEANAAAEQSEARAEREGIVRGVRAAFLAWYGAHQRRLLTEQAHRAAQDRAEGLEAAVANGSRSALDRDGSLVEAARLRLEVQRAVAAEADARLALGLAVGQPIADTATPDPGVVDVEPPRQALPLPPMSEALDLRRQAVEATRRAYRLRYAPYLTGSAQFNLTAAVNIPQPIPSYQVSIGLTVPLYDPRQRGHVESEMRARMAEMEATQVAIQTTALTNEARARARYESAIQEVVLAAEVVTIAQRAADGAEERWRVAGGTMDATLNARERERRAREELVKAQVDRTDAALRLIPVP